MSELKLEVGKKYQNRLGEVIEIIYQAAPDKLGFCFIGINYTAGYIHLVTFRPGGYFLGDEGSESSYDLIAEY